MYDLTREETLAKVSTWIDFAKMVIVARHNAWQYCVHVRKCHNRPISYLGPQEGKESGRI